MTSSSDLPKKKKFLLYPDPVRAPDVPARPAQSPNPRIYGVFLVVSAFLMECFGFVRKAAWKNAGFGSMRDVWYHIRTTEPRYDPTVYPADDEDGDLTEEDSKATNGAQEEEPLDPEAQRDNSVAMYRALYLSGRLTPLDVAQAILPLIRRDTSPPGEHSLAWIDVHAAKVIKAAEASTLRYKQGASLGPLDGVPTAVKDEFDLDGYKTTLGTPNDYCTEHPPGPDESDAETKNSWCPRRLDEAGALILGKLSMHEFGMDTSGLNVAHGTPRNPYNPKYYTGGSSSGSAYAVATGLLPVALGSDGGGSIRLPASFCSVFGLKPTHGRLSFHPNQNHSNTAAVNGPLAADMRSLITMYDILNVPHHRSTFRVPRPLSRKLLTTPKDGPKVLGIPEAWIARASPVVQTLCRAMIARLVALKGYTTVPIDIPLVAEGQFAHALTLLADAAALVPDAKNISAANRILLCLGRTTPAEDYVLAQKLRRVLMQHLAWLWQQHPGMIIVTPTSACAGWPIRSERELKHGISDGDQTMRTMEYVWMGNYCGVPSITVPAGYAKPGDVEEVADEGTVGKVPVGLMGTGEWCSEEGLLRFGLDAEEVGEGIRRRPPGWVDLVAMAKEKGKTDVLREQSV